MPLFRLRVHAVAVSATQRTQGDTPLAATIRPMPIYRLAVLGDPVEHSRSPEIHEAMLDLAGLEGSYDRVRADRDVLSRSAAGLRSGEWHGLNITMPLKSAAADISDRLSPQAERSHSVNTLLVRDDELWGHSTDSSAFRDLIFGERFGDSGTILLLGSGGSAAAALAAIDGQRSVYVSARRMEKAGQLAGTFGGEAVSFGTGVAGAVVINTTPLGMDGESLPEGIVDVAAGLIDLPYSSRPTPAVELARSRSIPTADGFEFLIRQAMDSFHLWTGAVIAYEDLVASLTNA